jgi:hypothetical protein
MKEKILEAIKNNRNIIVVGKSSKTSTVEKIINKYFPEKEFEYFSDNSSNSIEFPETNLINFSKELEIKDDYVVFDKFYYYPNVLYEMILRQRNKKFNILSIQGENEMDVEEKLIFYFSQIEITNKEVQNYVEEILKNSIIVEAGKYE